MKFSSAAALLAVVSPAVAFPGMLTERASGAQPAPPEQSDTSSKLVYDSNHPYVAPGPNDQRGPCPGLNTLANHGYLPHNGIATPQQIVTAVQTGFNARNDLAILLAWGGHLVDGNQLSNLLSIGAVSNLTGTAPPAPAKASGLDTHGLFEGDASKTRGDAQFGDNHSFNETLFQQLVSASKKFGGGSYNATVAGEVTYARFLDSKARNPKFVYNIPRWFTGFGESIFLYKFFVDGRYNNNTLSMTDARSFLQTNKFPTGFYRRSGNFGNSDLTNEVVPMVLKHYYEPGHNEGAGNYVVDYSVPQILQTGPFCAIYTKHVNVTVPSVYPIASTKGDLLTALKANLNTFYTAVAGQNCQQIFPYGQ